MRATPVVLTHPCVRDVLRGAVVVVIEDDASVRTAVKELIESVGLEARLYASAYAFLEADIPDTTSCLVLDVRLPEMSGIKAQEELSRAGRYVPIVFISGYADVAMAVCAMKAGAVDFLTKPFRSQDLLDAVFAALEQDSARRKLQQWQSILRGHYESLTARERQVITMVAAGKLNKQIAAELLLSEVTVKLHRANAMRKMRATSLPDLVKMLEPFDPGSARSQNSVTASTQLGADFSRSDASNQRKWRQLAHLTHLPLHSESVAAQTSPRVHSALRPVSLRCATRS